MESVPSNNDSPDSAKDVLRRGDLVRISAVGLHSSKRFKDREGQIGRISHWHQDEMEHVILYDVDWVLGGRTVGIRREDLEYTTAEQEGMTGDRNRQKRKPSHFMEEVVKQDAAKKKARAERKAARIENRKVASKLKSGVKAPKVKSAESKSKAAAKQSKLTKSAKIKVSKNAKAKDPSEKGRQSDKRKQSDVVPMKGKKRKLGEQPAPEPPAYTPLDLFEKQRREFERIVTRLQKVDVFSHFWDEIPAEYDECYTPVETDIPEPSSDILSAMESPAQVTVDEANDLAPPPPPLEVGSAPSIPPPILTKETSSIKQRQTAKISSSNKKELAHPLFPNHPPYNWFIVQRRIENGRYLTNREAKEQEERLKALGPYYKSIGKRPKKVNFYKVMKKSHQNPRVLYHKGIDWDTFKDDILGMCDARLAKVGDDDAGIRGSVSYAAKKIKEATLQAYERTGLRQISELAAADDAHKFSKAVEKSKNMEAAMQSWRKQPFPERRYERLSTDVVSAGLSALDERIASYELKTSLPDSFIGLSYRYDDTGQSEAWMKSVVDETGASKISTSDSTAREAAMALEADIGVIRAQVANTMNTLLIAVQDRVMTDQNVLRQSELRSANWMVSNNQTNSEHDNDSGDCSNVGLFRGSKQLCPEVTEQPVWGIDCYTRRNILACLETEFDPVTALEFVEKWLLPAINACPEEIAHEITNAARILEGLPLELAAGESDSNTKSSALQKNWSHSLVGQALREKIKRSAPCWLKAAANQLRRARASLGPDFFRIHPKGHGSILLCPKIEANRLVTFYRGEVYPSWRWGEKMDAIEITQGRKGLKPALPDFYNMALERPQTDPRGYGLLFVDASRKAGHGSSLSHSCAPTCEVRVAALNGELCLAMTTLRELEMGEELTFDYNAVTESLNEYRSAVCLCGYGKCRGSFLHFATADCYQRVLNRNAPVASRFASLVKGCMKQVMSDDDDRILKNHGFVTAAFGAISVNRRFAESHSDEDSCLDSIEMVPIWLRTFVADTLRYIEYERRALPIALICDHISKKRKPCSDPATASWTKEPKREPPFFYYSRSQMDYFKDLLRKQGFPIRSASRIEARQAVLRVASISWQSLDEKTKEFWKQQTEDDYQAKIKAWRNHNPDSKKNGQRKSGQHKVSEQHTPKADDLLNACDISFEDADAEGVSAMEQRIQQLTQTLSRVGRVLDRHREAVLLESDFSTNGQPCSPVKLRKLVNAPIAIVRDDEVIGWMWSSPHGVVSQLIEWVRQAPYFRSCLLQSLLSIKSKFKELDSFPAPVWPKPNDEDHSCSSSAIKGRGRLQSALMEMRCLLQKEFRKMGKEYRKMKLKAKQSANPGQTCPQHFQGRATDGNSNVHLNVLVPGDTLENESETCTADNAGIDHVDTVEQCEDLGHSCSGPTLLDSPIEPTSKDIGIGMNDPQEEASILEHRVCDTRQCLVIYEDGNCMDCGAETTPTAANSSAPAESNQEEVDHFVSGVDDENPWVAQYGYRFVLLLAADVLLLYAKTSTFFVIKPYRELQSTPIEVYARELGNSVPKSVIDDDISSQASECANPCRSPPPNHEPNAKSAITCELCQPDDIVAKVTVSYEGDFILSQLLQWYNGGIGQKKGLPDLLGCICLPSLEDCWQSDLMNKTKASSERRTFYESKVRPKLVEWFQDPFQRGSPWPEEISSAFRPKSAPGKISTCFQPFGSPVLDFLVTGAEENIHEVLRELDAEDKIASKVSSDGLLSSVDKGRPAQAVSNWVQCEDPTCMKWRKIPWFVDLDLLPEKFFCTDNKWNPSANRCDAPEEDWDDADALVGDDGKVEGSPVRKRTRDEGPLSPTDEDSFRVGARFDVQRSGKSDYTTGTVVKVDFTGQIKRILFHFTKTSAKHDEWIDLGSSRIASLYSKSPPSNRGKKKNKKNPTSFYTSADERSPASGGNIATNESESFQSACGRQASVPCNVRPTPRTVACDGDPVQMPDREHQDEAEFQTKHHHEIPTENACLMKVEHPEPAEENECIKSLAMTTDDQSNHHPQTTKYNEQTEDNEPTSCNPPAMTTDERKSGVSHATNDNEQTHWKAKATNDNERPSDYPQSAEEGQAFHSLESNDDNRMSDKSTSGSIEHFSSLFHSIMPIEEGSGHRTSASLNSPGKYRRLQNVVIQDTSSRSLEPGQLPEEHTSGHSGDSHAASARGRAHAIEGLQKRSTSHEYNYRPPMIAGGYHMQQITPKSTEAHHSFVYADSRVIESHHYSHWPGQNGSFSYHNEAKDHRWADLRINDVRSAQVIRAPQEFMQRQVRANTRNSVANDASVFPYRNGGVTCGGDYSQGTTSYGSYEGIFKRGLQGIPNMMSPPGTGGGVHLNECGSASNSATPFNHPRGYGGLNSGMFPPSNLNATNGVISDETNQMQKAPEPVFQSLGNGYLHGALNANRGGNGGTSWPPVNMPYIQYGSKPHGGPQR